MARDWVRWKLLFGVAMSALVASLEAQQLDWFVHDTPSTNLLRSVCRAPSRFLAVGDDSTVLTSPDGAVWELQEVSMGRHWLQTVTHGTNGYVAAGLAGVLLTSTNGIDWTEQNSGTGFYLRGAAFGGGRYVVVGDGGTILTSPTGQVWTRQESGVEVQLEAVASNGEFFVAVGDQGTVLRSNSGGTGWAMADAPTAAWQPLPCRGHQYPDRARGSPAHRGR